MRYQNYCQRLHNLWLSKNNEPFIWGKHDCVALALQAIETITDSKYPLREKYMRYNSCKSAYKLLGKQSLQQCLTVALKPFFQEAVDQRNLQTGDLVLLKSKYCKNWNANWNALAIVDLCPSGFVVPSMPRGITRIERKNTIIIKAWHIA